MIAAWEHVHGIGYHYQFDNICTLNYSVWLDEEALGK
jgi:hypothetical protein